MKKLWGYKRLIDCLTPPMHNSSSSGVHAALERVILDIFKPEAEEVCVCMITWHWLWYHVSAFSDQKVQGTMKPEQLYSGTESQFSHRK